MIVCTSDVLGMGPDFHVGNCVGSDHLPIHCNMRFDEHHPNKGNKIQGYYCAARKEPIGLSGKHSSMILVRDTISDVVELDF